jgi:hypothetical protein
MIIDGYAWGFRGRSLRHVHAVTGGAWNSTGIQCLWGPVASFTCSSKTLTSQKNTQRKTEEYTQELEEGKRIHTGRQKNTHRKTKEYTQEGKRIHTGRQKNTHRKAKEYTFRKKIVH